MDPVTPDVFARVLARDHGCVAAQIDPEHVCRDAFGGRHDWDNVRRLTYEHVHCQYGMMGDRAPSRPDHGLILCHAGNLYWGPAHRGEEREWLANHVG